MSAPSDAGITREDDTATVTDEAVSLKGEAAQRLAPQLRLPTRPTTQLGQLQVTLTGSS